MEVGATIILKHLVEEVGINVNAPAWCSYTAAAMGRYTRKTHLLAVALTYDYSVGGSSSLDYLLSREETNVHASVTPDSRKSVWEVAYELESCTCNNFRALLEHSSFEPNTFHGKASDFPILVAFLGGVFDADKDSASPADMVVRKFKILLDVGADPELVLGAGGRTLLDITKLMLNSFEESGTNPLGVQVGRQLVAAMQENVASGRGRSEAE